MSTGGDTGSGQTVSPLPAYFPGSKGRQLCKDIEIDGGVETSYRFQDSRTKRESREINMSRVMDEDGRDRKKFAIQHRFKVLLAIY
jgi:hypothetical protein